MNRRRFALLAGGAVLCGAVPEMPASKNRLEEELPWVSVPGVATARIDRGTIRGDTGGVLLAGTTRAVTKSSIFEAASLSKPLFAYAVYEQLIVSKKIDLDRPLNDYLPRPYPSDDPRTAKISARHVLTHTSGLPNWRHSTGDSLTVAFEPGTKYLYSGEGFYFLQTVVETCTQRGLAAFMRPTLDALGMHASDYVWRPSYEANAAYPHDIHGRPLAHDSADLGSQFNAIALQEGVPLSQWTTARSLEALTRTSPPRKPLPWNAMPNAAWSLLTTATEYAKFVQRLLASPQHPMLQPLVQTSPYVWRGLGIALQVDGRHRAFFHTGSNPGFKAVMFGDLKSVRGITSFANGEGGFPLNMHVVESWLGPQPAIFDLEQPEPD